MEISIEKVIALKETQDFLLTAKGYCSFIETTDATGKEFLNGLQGLLLSLYQQAATPPWTTLEHKEEFKAELSAEEMEKTLNSISNRVGADRYYWEVFDPTDHNDTEPVCGDLVDDIGDIYKDIKYGLITFDFGTLASRQDAIWHFKFRFEKHWGGHAISALRSIHFQLGFI
jgi:hypothetical protein